MSALPLPSEPLDHPAGDAPSAASVALSREARSPGESGLSDHGRRWACIDWRSPAVDEELIWERSREQSQTHTCFQTPEFIAAAARWLEPLPELQVVHGESATGGPACWGPFESVSPSLSFPFPKLRCWQTLYSFSDGLLHPDPDAGLPDELWRTIRDAGWHAIELPRLPLDSPLMSALQRAAEAGQIGLQVGALWDRPILKRSCSGPKALLEAISPQRAKSLRRGWNWLERHGTVDVAILRTPEAVEQAARTLLRLESLGWKGAAGTALASDPAHSRFFLDLCARLSRRRSAAFVEIRIDNAPIAGLALLLEGTIGYAFKLGWNPDYERGCPGFQLMAQLMSLLPSEFPDLEAIDSCAARDSFIGRIWPDRARFAGCTVALSRRAALCLAMKARVKAAFWSPPISSPAAASAPPADLSLRDADA